MTGALKKAGICVSAGEKLQKTEGLGAGYLMARALEPYVGAKEIAMTQRSPKPLASPRPAPDWSVESWLNTEQALSLEALRGKVIVLEAFQMLCPGCVQSSLPQAKRVHALFSREEVAVIGLHTVFEHHEAMTPAALKAFVKENQLSFPIGIDQALEGEMLPATMARYNMQGTPSLVLIDRKGYRRGQHFGHIADLQLGAEIMALMKEG